MRAHHRHIAAVVPRRVLLLVAAVVLLVDDDQAEVLHRREYAGAGTDHHVSLPAADPAPLLRSLGVMKRRMEDRDMIAEAVIELARHRGSQRDLRNQQQRIAIRAQSVASIDAQIDFGLAGAGHSLQQDRANFRDSTAASNRFKGSPLVSDSTSAAACTDAARWPAPPPPASAASCARARGPLRSRPSPVLPVPRGCARPGAVRGSSAVRAPTFFSLTLGPRLRVDDAKPLARGAQRIPVCFTSSSIDEAALLQVLQSACGASGTFFFEIGGRERAVLEQPQHCIVGSSSSRAEQQLARRIAARIRQRLHLGCCGSRRRAAPSRAALRRAARSSSSPSSGLARSCAASSTGSSSRSL